MQKMRNKILDSTLIKFIIVGTINTLTGTAIMFGLYNLAGASYWLSSAANYILVSVLSFILNKKFTFRHDGKVAESGFRFAVNIAVCYLIAYGVAKPLALMVLADCSKALQENIAMLLGMCLFTGLNYVGQKLFVFRVSEARR
jgi:putative flippase GtrA